MVNGTTSRVMYFGAFGLAGLIVCGMVIISVLGKPIPVELTTTLPTVLAFALGTHFVPANAESKPAGAVPPDTTVVVASGEAKTP